MFSNRTTAALLVLASLTMRGCTLLPEGTADERDRMTSAGEPYEIQAFEDRTLPELSTPTTWREVLRRAFLANGEIESAYFSWRAAVARIDAASSFPTPNAMLGLSYMFSSQSMTAWNRTTLSAGFDSTENLELPSKVRQMGRVALGEAKVAGERFRAAKFDVQKRVLFAWAEYEARARIIAASRRDLALVGILQQANAARASTSSAQESLVSSRVEQDRLENEVADLESQQAMTRAALNAMLGRGPEEPLLPPVDQEAPRSVPEQDLDLILAAALMFPEVAAVREELATRRDALELARMKWLPNFTPSIGITGTLSQVIGAGIMLPTNIPRIRAWIQAAEAEVRGSEALLRQTSFDRVGEYMGLVYTLRRAQAREAWLSGPLRDGVSRLVAARRTAYEFGTGSLPDVIEGERMLVEIDIALAKTREEMEKTIVDIECCLGQDIETVPSSPAHVSKDPAEHQRQEQNHG